MQINPYGDGSKPTIIFGVITINHPLTREKKVPKVLWKIYGIPILDGMKNKQT